MFDKFSQRKDFLANLRTKKRNFVHVNFNKNAISSKKIMPIIR